MASRLKQPQARIDLSVAAYKRAVAKLQVRYAKLEAENFTLKQRVKVLIAERKFMEPPRKSDKLDAARRIAFLFHEAGIRIVGSDGKSIK